ncbi:MULTISPECIES: mycothiol system anti-sigma-R factor [Sciscionella]|uniref:mycothiol system anti-sigma-R factor n=1 Tax=Sciscionella TaxID=596495 RepID=UPI00037CB0CB|nr:MULTISPECIES: mycothiol system anti-sigma-R factor [Sciscionella]
MNEERKPTEADCAEVLADIYVYLDHECDGQRKEVVQRHLDDCGSCLERYGIERQLKELLHRKCGGDHAPSELRDRLKASIREYTSFTSIEIEREG